MNGLPVVARELRVASRRSSSYAVRFLGATGAAMLGGLFLLATELPGALAPDGRGLMTLLSVAGLGLALIAGPVFTADSLSREKREGTLGLLFLTDLRGWDVVAGKFAALGLVPVQGLLAMFPIGAMSVFLGGVGWMELWGVLGVVTGVMGVSLAWGLWVSSRAVDERWAVGVSLAGVAVWVGVPWVLASMSGVRGVGGVTIPAWVGMWGPWGQLEMARGLSPGTGLDGLGRVVGAHLCVAVLLLAWTSVRLGRRGWVEDGRAGCWGEGGARRGLGRGVSGEGGLAWAGWGGWGMRGLVGWVTAGVVVVAWGVFFWGLGTQPFGGGRVVGNVVEAGQWLLKILVAVHGVYLLQDGLRSGTLELLVTTPEPSARLWAGHLAAVRRVFLVPFLVLALCDVGLGVGVRLAMGGDWPSRVSQCLAGAMPAVAESAIHGLDMVAVVFHSALGALRMDRPAKAILRTLVLVLVVPGLVCGVFCGSGRLVVDLLVIAAASQRLDRFRDLVRDAAGRDLAGRGG